MDNQINDPNKKTFLTIPFTNSEKRRIKWVAGKIGIGSCSSYIKMKTLEEVNKVILQYKQDKKQQMETTGIIN